MTVPMDLGERGLERAEAFERLEKDSAVARIRESLGGIGDTFCLGCGERIEEARRLALPSAKRCFDCQTDLERGR
ncbi:TraR/DksA C4-type zinc finger protein [Erythrobacter sp. WG]|uniref:TraR/DksA C4-type zinc finger protein n=1 Tax=Erythrobacter sp. WG TaxID=2985510 RepID=UPI00227155F2|nr:TraR/DksA C4-type zinc finger protein [Erythrobacter sp. WG]MCX9146602.1 TraR/DksA C4-type zinc finger protein [Erythrobacter sp. WG]